MKDSKPKPLTWLTLLTLYLLFFASITFEAWVASVLWAWFVASVFSLPLLGIAQAFGFLLFCRLAVVRPGKATPELRGWELCKRYGLEPLGRSLTFLSLGFIAHWCAS